MKKVVYALVALVGLVGMAQAQLVHPGALSTQADLDRMAAKVAAGAQPWKDGWDVLVKNEGFYMGGPEAVPTVYVDSPNSGSTYMSLARDSHRAYQAALRYHGSGDTNYADHAIQIMNTWANTHTNWDGNSNVFLRMGLYGSAFACAGELMRNYDGWNPADFAAFQQYMRDQFYKGSSWWIGAQTDSHYWANWTLANMDAVLAIGVLCDDQSIIDEALNHFYKGAHTGCIENSVYYVHPNGLGQWQESGRDQGHAQMGPQLIGLFCEIAWNQGYDLYGYMNNRVLAGVEYISKYNTQHAVPYAAYANADYATWPKVYHFVFKGVAGAPAISRPGWDLIYNHYVNRMGIAAPYTAKYAEATRPEGGGSNYGGNSGGFDGLGFTTLTHSRDPIADIAPGTLLPVVQGRQITLSWAGSAHATSYNVKRSTTSGGPYTTLGTVDGDSLFYVDPGLTAGTTYYYVVSANNPGGESANSAEVSATADSQLFGTVIGTDHSGGMHGATKEILFDGSLKSFIDIGGSGGGWAGLDLGSGVSAVITGVKYCPRPSRTNDMVGGKFQASSTADFSSGVVDLFTITNAPPEGVLTFQSVNSGSAYRYVRYIQPENNEWNIAAEVQFLGNVSGQSAPSTPTVDATRVDGLQIDLLLNGLSGIPGTEGYRIKRSTTPGGPYLVYGDVNPGYGDTTKFSDVETELGATYYYVVSAYNQFGESADTAEISCSTLPTGNQLMTHLKMNGNVADSSGNNFQAGMVGSPEFPGGGYVGSAIDLDGTNDFVTLHYRVADSDDITVAAWVNWDGGAPWQRIFDFGTGKWSYLYLTPSSGDGVMRFGIKNGSEQSVDAPSEFPTGTWTHVALTLSGDTATIYVNGSPVASSSSITNNPSDFKPGANFIGKSQWEGDALFNGRIDEFRVYNYALSAGDVAALASLPTEATPPAAPAGLGAIIGDGTVYLDWSDNSESDFASYTVYRSTTSGSGYSAIATGLTASTYTDNTVVKGVTYYYIVTALDTSGGESVDSAEVSSTTQGASLTRYDLEGNTLDSSGNGNHATATGSPAYATGKIGQAIDLDGSDDYLTIPSGTVSGVDNMTIATWVNWDGGGDWQRIFDFGDSTSRYLFLSPSAGGGKLRFAINNGSGEKVAETTNTLTTGSWVHLAVTLNGDTTTLYVDGSPVATNVAAINPTGFDFTPANNYIGKSQFGSDPLFNGRIDDFRIYNYALTPTQINDVMQGSDNLPPAAPAGLSATAGDSSVLLDWADNSEPDLASYTVYRSTTSGSGYASIASGLINSAYTDNAVTNGVAYYYVVTATDNVTNESAHSAESSATPVDTTAPAAPTGLGATAGDGTVSLDWADNSEPDLASYTVYRSATSGSGYASIASGLTTSAYTDNAVTNGSSYYYVVTATDNVSNESAFSTEVSATPHVAQAAYGGTPWAVPGVIEAEDYDVGGEGIAFHDTTAGNSGGSYRTDGVDLEPCGEGGYNIGYGADGEWTEYTVNVAAVDLYDIVLRVAATGSAGRGHIEIDGVDVTGLLSIPNTGNWQVYTDVTASGINLSAGQHVLRIYMDVAAWNLNKTTLLVVDTTPPAAPGGLSAAAGDGSVSLDWADNAEPDLASYTVYRSITSGSGYGSIASGLATSAFTDNSVANGTTYYYTVTAKDASSNESGSSTEVSAMPQVNAPSAPTGLNATAASISQVDLSWTASSGATGYNVKWANISGGPYTNIASNLGSTSYSDIGMLAGSSNYYVVSAVNAGGESASSAEASAVTPELVAYLPFDETNGTTAPDSSPNGFDGTLVNGASWTSGVSTNAVALDGVNGYISLPSGVLGDVGNCTLSAWVRLNTLSSWSRIFDFGSGTTTNMFLTPKNGATGNVRFAITTGGGNGEQRIDGISALPTNLWTHVAVTWSNSVGILYVDGMAVGTNSTMTLYPASLGNTTQNYIGKSQYPDPYLDGAVDDFRIVGRPLSATEIAAEAKLIVDLPFNETNGTVSADSSPNGYDATLVNGAVLAAGGTVNVLQLDGVNDYASLPSGVVGGLTNFTVSTWVYQNTLSTWSRIFDFGTGTSANMFLTPKNGANGKVRFAITTAGGGGEQRIDGLAALPTNSWTHVAITRSGNTGILYVDGTAVGTNSTMTLGPASLGTTTQNYIGKSQYADPYLNGGVDDFRIIGRAMSASEISELAK